MSDFSERRPRLLVLTSTLPRWESDSEPRFVLDLAASMTERFDPVILAPMASGAAPAERISGVSIIRYRYAPFRSWERLASPGAIMPNLRRSPWYYALIPFFFVGQFRALVRLLRRENFDIVHCHWLIPQGLVLAIVSFVMKVPPVLVTCHGADAFTLDSRLFRYFKAKIAKRFSAVSVVSREIAVKIEDVVGPGAPGPPLHIPMGVDIEKFSMRSRRLRKTPTILFAGRLAAKKGVEVLLEAFAHPTIQSRDVRLRIAGNGPLLHDLKRTASQLRLDDKVEFIGAISHDQLALEMARATIFCAPFVISEDGDREGTPTVLLEAAASGLPIITSDVGGCSEVVRGGRAGWLLPAGDENALAAAIIDALGHPNQRQRFAKAARDQAKNYSWPVIAERYVEVLEGLLKVSVEQPYGD